MNCLNCNEPLSDADERHGYRTCDRCAPGHVPEGVDAGWPSDHFIGDDDEEDDDDEVD